MGILYYSTNSRTHRVTFERALLEGQPDDYGLYMIPRDSIPLVDERLINRMKRMSYADIAFVILSRYLQDEIPDEDLHSMVMDAYDEEAIPTEVQNVTGRTHILWLTRGPTYSFKDYAARFFARALNHFLGRRNLKRTVVVATSGDTGGAIADALHGLENVECVIFYPKDSISEGQRRQMTTLGGNVHAFQVNGDFDVCQGIAKQLLADYTFAEEAFGDAERITSANSISLGRLLPQVIYPFYAYARAARIDEEMTASIPSGNFGDMMGTLLAKGMGLPISRIVCGVNANKEFPEFLKTGEYHVTATARSPSSAMNISHPSNLARVMDYYGGHMFDERDPESGKLIQRGKIDVMPDMAAMRRDIAAYSISDEEHFETMKKVYETYGIILDPHGAVGWRALERNKGNDHSSLNMVYETADPGKFPDEVKEALGFTPELPERMQSQRNAKEDINTLDQKPKKTKDGFEITAPQMDEVKDKLRKLLS